MGDGRYYTPEQFFNIIFLTAFIIFMMISFMVCLYKNTKYKKYIISQGVFLSVSLVSRFVSEIHHTNTGITLFKWLGEISLGVYIIICIIFYINFIREAAEEKMIIVIGALLFIIATVIFIFNVDHEKIVYPLFTIHFGIISNRFVKYRVSQSVFSDVKKLMLDYVFIIGINGDVIFRSDKVRDSDIFRKTTKINVFDIENVFYNDVVTRSTFGKQFIKLSGDEIFYFQYHKKEIFDKEKLAGYILTFTDITELISMLDKLSAKQEETSKINAQLIKYKEIVYDIEKEKEINYLLDEIANNQQKAMIELKCEIEKLDVNHESIIPKIEKLIITAKSNLKDVREAVTEYINYYEEGGYND